MTRRVAAYPAGWALACLGALACRSEGPDAELPRGLGQPLDPRVYQLQSVSSGKCLDVAGASTANGANIQQWACGGADNQNWLFTPRPDGSYRIRAQHSDKCMVALGKPAAGGDNIQQGRCIYKRSKWWVNELGGDVVELQSAKSLLCADIEGNSTSDGANVVQWDCLGVEAFLALYGQHLLDHDYWDSPLERMARALEADFSAEAPPFDARTRTEVETRRLWSDFEKNVLR